MSRPDRLKRRLKKALRYVRRGRAEKEPGAPAKQAVLIVGELQASFPKGTTLLKATIAMDLEVDHFCGGLCACGTCRVGIVQGAKNLSKARPNEQMVLGVDAFEKGDRLACQARLEGEVEVKIPDFFMV